MNRLKRKQADRPKAFWGALISAGVGIASALLNSSAQRKQRQLQANLEDYNNSLKEAQGMTNALNAGQDYQQNYLQQFKQQARLGTTRRLGSRNIMITDGGNAKKIGNNTYLLRGGSHEDINETGQTGIGINVGGNEIEAEGGEVAQRKGNSLRIYSAQPILGGISPAEAIIRGYNKDRVFNAQQRFKKNNGIKDDGSQQRIGGEVPYNHYDPTGLFGGSPHPLAKMIDITGITSYGDVKKLIDKKRRGEIPTTQEYLGALSAIPAIGRIAKGLNLIGNITDATSFMKDVKESEAKENAYQNEIVKYRDIHGKIKTGRRGSMPYSAHELRKRYGGLTSKDRGSSKHPYPSVSSKDFAGGNRSYPIPTKADAIDALRLAGLHGRSDVKAKVYSRYPELREKARGGAKIEPYYDWARNTSSNLGISFIDPDYDYRAYYNSVTPYERALIRFAPKETHFGDIGKTPKHATFSNESKYSNDKTTGGTWNGNVFVPNIWQFGNNGNSRRNKYMNNSGEGYFNGRVNVFPTSRKRHRLGCRTKLRNGGWKAPVYNTKKYRVSNRMRQQIATWEGSDFAGQNRKFNGDAIGAKERELRQIMGRTYNYLTDNQRDSLNSIYYNSRVDTFKNRFGKWFKNLNDAVDRGDERAFNNSLAGIRQSMTIGENRQGMSGLAKRRAWERNWFGNPIPMDSNETKAILKQQAEARMVQPKDNTRVVIQPEYIEVPAPVGHGVVPVDNPDPNLLQGNIKDNLINMGNRFRLGQRCGGKTRMRCGGKIRMRKSLGCESRPVKGMRSKLAWGDVVYPYRRNNNFDYWDVIDQEQKANDKGGITPWTTSNKYDVKVPYAITKSTPTIPYTSKISTPTSKVTENKTIPTYIGNKSGMILRNADWYGLGADLVSSIGGGILGLGAYKNLNFDYNLPNFVEESPVALNTTYHNEAQKSNVERNRLNSRNSILRNTMSGSTAVGRMQGIDTNALYQLNQLADEKTNKETELMNQNLLNEQQVRARNAAAKNQYYNTVASIKNAAIQAKNEAELAKGQILSGTLQGIGNSFQNFISQGRQNYDDTQAMLMGVAASDYATPSRLLELGVDVGDDAALAGIYRSAMNIPNPGARPKREDYSDNTEYSYALTRWENQNKAYQRRNSYADLIKGRMSKKNLIKYGII